MSIKGVSRHFLDDYKKRVNSGKRKRKKIKKQAKIVRKERGEAKIKTQKNNKKK